MSTTTDTRTPDQINEGVWKVRVAADHRPDGMIARRGYVKIDGVTWGDQGVYEATIVLRPGRTTLDSAKKIIEHGNPLTNVLPITAWRIADDGETVLGTFTWPAFRI
jgi:hypothetical protein